MFNLKMSTIQQKLNADSCLAVVFMVLIFILGIVKLNALVLLSAGVFWFIFIIFKKYIWMLLYLVAPALTMGITFSIPITEQWSYDITLAEIFIFIVALNFVVDIALSGWRSIKFSWLSYVLIFYVLIAILSGLYAYDKQLFLAGLKIPVFTLFSYILASHYLKNAERMKWFLFSLSAAAIIISTQIIFLFYTHGFSSRFFFDRSSLTIPIGAIAFASSILVMLLPTIFSFALTQHKYRAAHAAVMFAFILGFIAIFITLGKGAILSLFIGLGFLFLALQNRRYYLFFISALMILILGIAFSSLFANVFERLTTVFVDQNTHFRWYEYQVMWRIIKQNYLLGVGVGQQLYYYNIWLFPGYTQLANNMIMQIFMDLGMLGLAIFVSIAFALRSAIKTAFTKIHHRPILLYGIIASIIASFFNGLVEVTYFGLAYAIIFWLLMGSISNVYLYEKRFSHHH